jgi:signal transduction histidine kinase
VRRISSDLRPPFLDDLGLIAAVEWHLQQFQARTGIVGDFETTLEKWDLIRIGPPQSSESFRRF